MVWRLAVRKQQVGKESNPRGYGQCVIAQNNADRSNFRFFDRFKSDENKVKSIYDRNSKDDRICGLNWASSLFGMG